MFSMFLKIMAKTRLKDFIEIEYTGRIQETNQIFDLTSEELAKKENIHNPQAQYGPKVICLGEKHILPALDRFLMDKEPNKTYKIELKAKDAFGIKNTKFIKIMSAETLRKQKINPFPGLQISVGGRFGIIRSVAGGRVTVDFNHPLTGKNIIYEIKINKIIEKDEDKLKSMLENELGLSDKEYELKIEDKKAKISLKSKVPQQSKDEFLKNAKKLISSLEASFT